MRVEKSKISKPMPASVARMAFLPLMLVREKGRRPPEGAPILVKSDERLPSLETSQTARKPGSAGGVPLTEATNLSPASLKMM